MLSKLFEKSTQIASVSTLSLIMSGSAHAEQTPVTFDQYCSAQNAGNPALVHKEMHPFRNDGNVEITLQSSKYGSITMPFNCGSLIPYCASKQFAFTGSAMSIIHSGLAGYNRNDAESARKVMAKLAGDFNVYEPGNRDAIHAENHLDEVHDMDILNIRNGKVERAPNGTTIVKACAAQLNR